MKYFDHDTDARRNPKLIKLRLSGNREAEGCYWAVIEWLHGEERDALDCEPDDADWMCLCHDLCATPEQVEEWIDALVECGLLVRKGAKQVTSTRADANIERYRAQVANGRKGGRPRSRAVQTSDGKPNQNPNHNPNQNPNGNPNHNPMHNPNQKPNETQPETKEKEKEKEKNKEKEERESRLKYGRYGNVLLTDAEFKKLKAEFPDDWLQRIERLSEYMASSGKRYKSHLATIRNWAWRDAERSRASPVGYGVYTVGDECEGWIPE